MQLLRLHAQIDNDIPPLAFTIGNFDGVHKGHQQILEKLKLIAHEQGLDTAVMFFEPQPKEFLNHQHAPPRISSWQEKVELLDAAGIDFVILATFDDAFRSQSAQVFSDRLHALNVKHIMVGDDFRFGNDRSGDSHYLKRSGFHVHHLDTVVLDEERISSTRIRHCLMQGQLDQAAQLLGRPYSISGRVEHGDQIGRTIDFPTANIALNRPTPCLHGIYGVEVMCIGDTSLKELAHNQHTGISGYTPHSLFGAANIGTRPAIKDKPAEWRLEVHLPHYQGDLYGQTLQITFLHFLHGERNYASLDALKAGIFDDVKRLLAWREATPDFPILR